MAKITWKIVNGCGPYAYLQRSVRQGDRVTSEHIQYLGKLGAASKVGSGLLLPAMGFEINADERVVVPTLPTRVTQRLKPLHRFAATEALAGTSVTKHLYNGEALTFQWDEDKRTQTFEERHLDFDDLRFFGWQTANYYSEWEGGELRKIAIGVLRGNLHHVVYTERGDDVRVISLRFASRRERRSYVE